MPEEVQQPVVDDTTKVYEIMLNDERVVYKSSLEEFDDCFYAVISLMSWSKTFTPKQDLSLTFSTITNEEHLELLKNVRTWSELNNVSGQMFESYMTKINLAYYLTVIKVQDSTINLREKPVEDRVMYLSKMPEVSLNFYGMYNFIFNEIVRKALVEPLALKNS